MKKNSKETVTLFDNQVQSMQGLGKKTKKSLEKKGIVSPPINKAVHVKGSTYMVPKIDVSDPEVLEKWRQDMIVKHRL